MNCISRIAALAVLVSLAACATNMTPYQLELAKQQREKVMAEPSLYDGFKKR